MCNEFARDKALGLATDKFRQLKIPFKVTSSAAGEDRLAFPRSSVTLLRPINPAAPDEGFEAIEARWGMLPNASKTAIGEFKASTNNARDDKIGGEKRSMWDGVYGKQRGLIAVDRFFEYEDVGEKYKKRWAVRLADPAAGGAHDVAFFPALWAISWPTDHDGPLLSCANVTGGKVPDVPFHGRLARLVDLRRGMEWCDLQGQGIGPLKATPPEGTFVLEHEVRPN